MNANQDKNAGNRGDVWKHRTVLAILNKLLDQHQGPKPFRYFESHAGKGVYLLRDSKGARDGIHEAIARFAGAEDEYVLAEADAVAAGNYLGSWKLVLERLSARGISAHLELWDKDPSVLAAAGTIARANPNVRLCPGDGFAAAPVAEADLYFIDPFANWSRSAAVSRQLADKTSWFGTLSPQMASPMSLSGKPA